MALPIPDSELFNIDAGDAPSGGGGLGSSITGILTSIAPDIVRTGTQLLGSSFQNNAIDDAKDRYSETTQASADRLNKGYDEALGYYTSGTEDLNNILNRGLTATSAPVKQGFDQFSDTTRDAYTNYAGAIYPQYENYTDILNQTADESGGLLGEGAEAVETQFAPYQAAGSDGLAYMRSILQADPSTLSPSQKRTLDDFRRQAIARLAATGLRGSGRAQVAVVNDGLADLTGKFYDQNQSRMDSAASTLSGQGYSATGQIAGAQQGAKNAQAGLVLSQGNKLADVGYNTAQDVAGKAFAGESAIAGQVIPTADKVANLTGQYYSNLGNTSAGLTNAKVDVAKGKATVDATAAGKLGDITYGTNVAKAANTGAAINGTGATTNPAVPQIITTMMDDAKKKAINSPGTTVVR